MTRQEFVAFWPVDPAAKLTDAHAAARLDARRLAALAGVELLTDGYLELVDACHADSFRGGELLLVFRAFARPVDVVELDRDTRRRRHAEPSEAEPYLPDDVVIREGRSLERPEALDRLRAMRRRGLSVDDVARRAGVTPRTVQRLAGELRTA